jgi:DNA polymerase-3 subunit delta'
MAIVGHKNQREFLKKSFNNSKMSHAYLFSGLDAIGKKEIALEFAQLINKQKKDSPDIIIVEPELSIKILQIENMQKRLSLKPFSAPYKIAIINDADKMTVHAQNRLLKTLEEPKGQTIIILISSKPETLLETIISRVQSLKFYALSKQEMRNFLKEKVSISELEKLIFISEGKPGKAISLIKDSKKMDESWKMFNDIKNIIKSDIASRFKYINDFLNKDNYKEFLDIFLRYFRLTLLAKISEVEIGDKFKNNFSIKNIQEIIKLSERVNYLFIRTNVSEKLALETLLLSLPKTLNNK